MSLYKVGKVGNPSDKVGANTAQHRLNIGNVTDLLPTFYRLITEVIEYVTDFTDFLIKEQKKYIIFGGN